MKYAGVARKSRGHEFTSGFILTESEEFTSLRVQLLKVVFCKQDELICN